MEILNNPFGATVAEVGGVYPVISGLRVRPCLSVISMGDTLHPPSLLLMVREWQLFLCQAAQGQLWQQCILPPIVWECV